MRLRYSGNCASSTEASFCLGVQGDWEMQEKSREEIWEEPRPPWTLVTSHGLALLFVATHPDATAREVAVALELTDRRVTDIIRELTAAGLVLVTRRGRHNQYALNPNAHFRHPLVADIPFRAFVRLWRWSHREGRRSPNPEHR